jgi:hypothetical protein
MVSADDTPWSLAVRVLSLLSAVLLVVVFLEARTVRQVRAELQQLRSERDQTKANIAAAWTRRPLEEADSALRWLDTFYAEPTEGFGRKGGLCGEGRLNDRAITAYLVGGFLASRGAGDSYDASIAAMRAQIVKTDDYRAVHPELATPLPAVK